MMKEKLFIPPPAPIINLLEDEPQAFKRILIMEDNREVAAKMQKYLEARHFDLFFAKTAISALREIIESDFDLVICDMIKPNFSGQMFHIAVSRVKPYLCNRFIFITGRGTPAATSAFIKQVNGVMLWRPFEMHVLLETINLVLKKQCAEKEVLVPEKKPGNVNVSRPSRPVRNTNADNLRIIHLSLNAAAKSIRIVSSYFLSDEATVKILLAARQRRVEVEIFVPSQKNGQAPDSKVQAVWARLLEAGVKIYAMESTPDVGRIIICDDLWVCFTQSNFHAPNVNIYHKEFTDRYLQSMESQRDAFEEIKTVRAPSLENPTFVFSPGEKAPADVYSRLKAMLSSMMPGNE